MIVLSYLTELKLYQLNTLESHILYSGSEKNNKEMNEKKNQFTLKKKEFNYFIKDNIDNLHKETTQ